MSKVSWQSEFVDYLWQNISEISAILIINDKGKILEDKVALQFKKNTITLG